MILAVTLNTSLAHGGKGMRFWQILFSCGGTVAVMLIVDKVKTLSLGLSQSLACPPVG